MLTSDEKWENFTSFYSFKLASVPEHIYIGILFTLQTGVPTTFYVDYDPRVRIIDEMTWIERSCDWSLW